MAILTAISLGISAASSIAQAIRGEKRRKDAKRALENFQRQELRNVTEGMRVSTLGAQLQTQEAQRRFATSVEALRSGGVRALVGGLQQQEAQQQQLQQQISADLDRQQMSIEQMRAQDEGNIRSMIEQRESAQIAGLGEEMAAGRRQAQAGLSGLTSTALAAFQVGAAGGFGGGSGASNAASGGAPTLGGFDTSNNALAQGARDMAKSYFGNSLGSGMPLSGLGGNSQAYTNRFGLSSIGVPQVKLAGPTGGVFEGAGFVKQ